MSQESSSDRTRSVVERLSAAVGSSIDPEVELDPRSPERAAPEASESGSDSKGVLKRMRSRPALSSRYSVEGEIARGGMGAILEVWDEDLRRRLAMKVALAKSGASGVSGASGSAEDLDPRVLSRFLEEAQVTGQLEHPGIVPVHELGVDDNGVVFFTMQLVRGRDLGKVFRLVPEEAEGWSVTRVLGVLLKVCEAMAYAHSKGVVHRDLKPANVMVGHFGEVYVMDWGLVRVQGRADRHDVRVADGEHVDIDLRTDAEGGSSAELYTMDGDVLGTPAYMSPEQARGNVDEIDERSDVYSVGAMLYHLLTGLAPYNRKAEPAQKAHEALLQLYEGPPPSLAALASDAPAELVAIADKAMARDAAERYPDMQGLAEDLRAYLENRVVQAYQTGAWAEARKWVGRNRALAASIAAGVLALVGGLAASLTLKAQSDENAERAQRQAIIAREVADFMNDDLFAAIAPQEDGIDVTVAEVLRIASTRLDGRLEGQPRVEAELRRTIGTSYQNLGDFETALSHLERSHELWSAESGETSEPALSTALLVAWTNSSLARFDEALEMSERTLAKCEAERGADDELTLGARMEVARAVFLSGELDRAKELLAALEGDVRTHLGDAHPLTLSVLTQRAGVLLDLGEFEEAGALQVEAFHALRESLGEGHPRVLGAGETLGEIYMVQGRLQEAEEILLATQAQREEVLGPDHPATANGLGMLGIHYFQQGRAAEAAELFGRGFEMLQRGLGSEHPYTLQMANNLAGAWVRIGRGEEALELRQRTLEVQRRVLGEEHPQTILSLGNLAVLLQELKRYEEAELAYGEMIELRERVLGKDNPQYWTALENLSGLWLDQGRHQESIELTQRVYEGRRDTLGPEHPAVARTCYNLGIVASEIGDREQARSWYQEAVTIGRLSGAVDVASSAQAQLAELLAGAGDLAGAQQSYLEAVEDRRAFGITDRVGAGWTTKAGELAFQLKDYDQAAALFEQTLVMLQDVAPADDEVAIRARVVLVRSLIPLERFEDAEANAIELLEILVTKDGEGTSRVELASELLADVYEAWGRPEDAALWR